VFDALVVGVPDERYGNCVAAVKPDYRWAKDTTEERPADDAHANHVGTPS
jgi:hypothetical protein